MMFGLRDKTTELFFFLINCEDKSILFIIFDA